LRRGKVVGTCTPRDVSARDMAEMMVGAVLTPPARAARKDWGDPQAALEVSGLSLASPIPFGTSLKDISFSVQRGEILGIAGVAGNGQDELLLALSGELRSAPDMVKCHGKPIGEAPPNARRAMGFVAAPEDRLGHAAAPDMSLVENALLSGAVRKDLTRNGFIDWAKTKVWAEEVVAQYDVRTPGTWVAARALSGGNLQKFLMGRELSQTPEVVIINQPTWGVDAAAAAFIRQEILNRAQDGAAVVVISQDLDDLLEVSDRFAALNEGRLTPTRPTEGLTVDEIGLMMGGAHGMEVAHHG
jgi:general nucleoside transport system ATP-binding protein